jgi:hypothetical protein
LFEISIEEGIFSHFSLGYVLNSLLHNYQQNTVITGLLGEIAVPQERDGMVQVDEQGIHTF